MKVYELKMDKNILQQLIQMVQPKYVCYVFDMNISKMKLTDQHQTICIARRSQKKKVHPISGHNTKLYHHFSSV